MIIDGHAHACGVYLTSENITRTLNNSGTDKVILVPGELNSSAEYYLPNLAALFPDRNVVKATNLLTKIVVKLSGMIEHIQQGNEYVHALSLRNDRVIQFIWITTRFQNPVDYLNEKFTAWHFSGIKLHQCWDNFTIDSRFFNEIADWTEKKALPLFIHLYTDAEVKKIIEYKIDHPNLKLIIAHLFGLELFIKEKHKLKNLFFDISSPPLISKKRLVLAIKSFGSQSLILGSDNPYGKNNLKKNIDRVLSLDISDQDKISLLGDNLVQLLPINSTNA